MIRGWGRRVCSFRLVDPLITGGLSIQPAPTTSISHTAASSKLAAGKRKHQLQKEIYILQIRFLKFYISCWLTQAKYRGWKPQEQNFGGDLWKIFNKTICHLCHQKCLLKSYNAHYWLFTMQNISLQIGYKNIVVVFHLYCHLIPLVSSKTFFKGWQYSSWSHRTDF